jgi:O-antigen/teichoic acid export membrane protein
MESHTVLTADGARAEKPEPDGARINRNLSDLLQELRVAGLGVQVLFGFLLSLPFTVRFARLDGTERNIYRASLLCAALSIVLLISPVAYHRWTFRRRAKEKMLRMANVQALVGLLMEALAVCLAVWLVLVVVGLDWAVALFAALVTGAFALLWFVQPILDRLAADAKLNEPPPASRSGPVSTPSSPGGPARP